MPFLKESFFRAETPVEISSPSASCCSSTTLRHISYKPTTVQTQRSHTVHSLVRSEVFTVCKPNARRRELVCLVNSSWLSGSGWFIAAFRLPKPKTWKCLFFYFLFHLPLSRCWSLWIGITWYQPPPACYKTAVLSF